MIGSGTAGLSARRQAEEDGRRLVLIEAGPYGTMCARVGSLSSRLLIAAADAAHELVGTGRFGTRLSDRVEVDPPDDRSGDVTRIDASAAYDFTSPRGSTDRTSSDLASASRNRVEGAIRRRVSSIRSAGAMVRTARSAPAAGGAR